ncbi:MAG: hypothetical protein ABIR70_18360 [Bryobacteraceae bacterium]
MFFRREKPQEFTLDSRLANLKQFGFETSRDGSGKPLASRNGCAANVEDAGDGKVTIGKAGILVGGEIAHLVHGGYQMFLRTPSGKQVPAQASQLKALHAFDEDLREGLGLTSLYNTALGTTCDDHLYDRVKDRDAVAHARPWEKSQH